MNRFAYDDKREFWEMVDGPRGPRKYKAPSKYQANAFDISMLLSFEVMVSELEKRVSRSHDLIREVYLIDVFKKEEWVGYRSLTGCRSLTLRCIFQSYDKTLTKGEINDLGSIVKAVVKGLGGKIR